MKTRATCLAFVLIVFLSLEFYHPLSAKVLEQDSLALVALYDSTNGAGWTNNTNWLMGDVSTWHGIYVSDNRVINMDLQQNNLAGHLPPQFRNLTRLEYCQFYGNQLTGSIPLEIFNLTKLTFLNFHSNQLTGGIPPPIGNLTKLTHLGLFNNQLTGTIPTEIGLLTNLTILMLGENRLEGSIP